jgi:prevent-host-death family protein
MGTVSASEANRSFSALLRQVSQGERITVVSRGRPVAMISPVQESGGSHRVARRALLARLQAQPATDLGLRWRREELYE